MNTFDFPTCSAAVKSSSKPWSHKCQNFTEKQMYIKTVAAFRYCSPFLKQDIK